MPQLNNLKQIRQYLRHYIWECELSSMPRWQAYLVSALRIAYLILRDVFFDSQLTMQAMSLVYTTLLALVPLIAVSVSVLKGFGVYNQIEPLLLNILEPLGDRGVEIASTITQFVNKINSGVLGSLGLALLLYSVVSLIQKIAHAFNHSWRVSEERSWAQRFSNYLSVILIGPVLVFTALGLTASLANTTVYQKLVDIAVFSMLAHVVSYVLPFILVIIAFALIYIYIPNTRVKFLSAMVGATIAGVMWQVVGWLFTWFVATANYTQIYSAFATLFFFMIWLYVSWSILLMGASIAFYYQYPEQRIRKSLNLQLSNRMKERLALTIMAQAARRFYSHQSPLRLVELSQQLNIAVDLLHPVVTILLNRDLLVRTDTDPQGYVPAQAPETLSLLTIVDVVRQAEEDEILNLQRLPKDAMVDHYFDIYQNAAANSLADVTLKELVLDPQQMVTPLRSQG
jgi:membrane protein